MTIEKVIDKGFCIGCGACACAAPDTFRISSTPIGTLTASIRSSVEGIGRRNDSMASAVCPFSEDSLDEDHISAEVFDASSRRSAELGSYLACYAGHVNEGDFRVLGSSGGLTTWLLAELLSSGMIDAVVHVRELDRPDGRLFGYGISRTRDDLLSGTKSRYYPVEMSEVLDIVKGTPGRYAVTAIPCFAKSIRLLCKSDPILNERICFVVGLVCGHLKSRFFGDFFAWQLGLESRDIASMDFRKRLPGRSASQYGIEFTTIEEGTSVRRSSPMSRLYGSDWGLGYFKYKACEFCDDVLAETADVTLGDAWLPEYEADWQGTNVVVVRSARVLNVLEKGIAEGRIALDRIEPGKVAESQRSGLRHRREGLAVRLAMLDNANQWRPKKRVKPSEASSLVTRRAKVYASRYRLVQRSFDAYQAALESGSLMTFRRAMAPHEKEYFSLLDESRGLRRFWRRTRRAVRSILIDWRIVLTPKRGPSDELGASQET